jgi:hypothetical protein
MSEDHIRTTRSARPMMSIPLPPKFEFNDEVDDEFLTPPIWVASNPPPMFERPEMKRTMSEVSSWGGDEDDESAASSESQEKEEEEEEVVIVQYLIDSILTNSYNDRYDCRNDGHKHSQILV